MKDGGRRHLPFELHENSGRIATGTFGRTVTIEWPLEIFKQMSGNCKRAARLQLLCRNSVIQHFSGNCKDATRLQLPHICYKISSGPCLQLPRLRSSNDTLAQNNMHTHTYKEFSPYQFHSGLKLVPAPAATRSASNSVLLRHQSRAGRLKALSSTPCQSMGTGL
jgi:hypothetical protein